MAQHWTTKIMVKVTKTSSSFNLSEKHLIRSTSLTIQTGQPGIKAYTYSCPCDTHKQNNRINCNVEQIIAVKSSSPRLYNFCRCTRITLAGRGQPADTTSQILGHHQTLQHQVAFSPKYSNTVKKHSAVQQENISKF